jgi:hypothetical protein
VCSMLLIRRKDFVSREQPVPATTTDQESAAPPAR